jgi:hypothetical protein
MTSNNRIINNKSGRIWKKDVVAYPRIMCFPGGTKESTKVLNQDNLSMGRDFNAAPLD